MNKKTSILLLLMCSSIIATAANNPACVQYQNPNLIAECNRMYDNLTQARGNVENNFLTDLKTNEQTFKTQIPAASSVTPATTVPVYQPPQNNSVSIPQPTAQPTTQPVKRVKYY